MKTITVDRNEKSLISESENRINKDNPISAESRNKNVEIQKEAKKQVSPI